MKKFEVSALGLQELGEKDLEINGGICGIDDVTFWALVGMFGAAYAVVKLGYGIVQGWNAEGSGEEIQRR